MNIKTIITVVIAVAILVLGTFVYMDVVEQERLAEEKKVAEQRARDEEAARQQAIAAKTKCAKYADFFAITFDRDGGVGQDILVKNNKDGVDIVCDYSAADGDFELKNSDPQYLKGVAGKAVVTDVGTGPSGRSLRIYDLTDKSLVTEKKYFGEMTIASSTLTYFGLAKEKASKKNCKEYDELTKDGGTANLVVEKNVNLETYSVKEGKTTKCVGGQ
jgi:hypothetical protein